MFYSEQIYSVRSSFREFIASIKSGKIFRIFFIVFVSVRCFESNWCQKSVIVSVEVRFMAEESREFYAVDEPDEQSWWREATGDKAIHGVMKVFYESGVEPVCDNQENYIDPREDAFTEGEYIEICKAAENIYDNFEEFMKQVKDSSIHPQQTYQIDKAKRYEKIDKEFPVKFGPYDGIAVTESILTDY